ncbi:YcbK family protein [Mongoliimonas terrestris]|uniref:YcbK family protein n=1 Tax=Mongoliimonas terrestris TaxID=1709001 RepID=UPI0009496536|nr:D-Ala-D-Ala carboxypeptidase family metallohydrolase [Mongoliimonas terrestris]
MRLYSCVIAALALLLLVQPTYSEDREGPKPRPRNTQTAVADKTLVAYIVQTKTVNTSCFTPGLQRLLGELKRKLGNRQLMVTSGFRGPQRARRGSYHRRCMAADVQVAGISPRQVAAAARSIKGIGGVGTYCHTRSVHVDVGPRRDWRWSCGKRRR